MIHGRTESYAVDDSRIIADGSDFFRASLAKPKREGANNRPDQRGLSICYCNINKHVWHLNDVITASDSTAAMFEVTMQNNQQKA
ncbi:hypothetical protein HHSLTHF2_03640 [Vreelandella venusta]|uniref:Uncharacterized protein n=1 Tax=Halomonas hydrothermalis TaxID=115561 RepID=A0A6F8TZU6_9GAMM|nr:hypothetical protein HHSLTHF2_03640 [Halomonas hydrothermalis]